AWWAWLRVEDLYAAAKVGDQLAARYGEIHSHRVRRRWWTLGTAAGAIAVLGVAELVEGPLVWWLAGGTVSAALAVAGRRSAGAGRKAVLGARSWTVTMSGDSLVDAFRAAKLIGKDEGLIFVQQAKRDGAGWHLVVDLPASRRASTVVASREALASALAVDEVRLIAERVRGDAGHAGRLSLWIGDGDPYAAAPLPWPLASADSFDFWKPVPFGITARGQVVPLPMVWTSLLVGAIPRMGKTFCARIPATGAALDPYTLLIVFDGKGGKDWRPFEQVAYRYGRGDDDETCTRLLATLRWAAADVARRFDRLAEMDDELCPESKVTPEITRNPALNMPLVLINVDEVQVYLEDETPVQVGVDAKGKPRFKPRGRIVCDLLTYIAKKGPAAGYMLNLATQKPDGQVIPDKLRGQLGTRFALRVMTWQASETILGAGTYKAGFDASKLLKAHKGVGLLLGADGETELDAGEAITARTYKLDIVEIRACCERGRALREAAGTLIGDAAGDRLIDEVDPVVAARIDAEAERHDTPPAPAAADIEDAEDAEVVNDLPPVLAALVEVLDGHETGLVATAELATRIGWEPKPFGEALRAAGVPAPAVPRQRINGSLHPVSVTDLDTVRAVVIAHVDR
ncbi:MAG: cell division protein FtsK, partial [Kutzneria sp.]|nr:cell division protein FtsK [Kutzneria sp.]